METKTKMQNNRTSGGRLIVVSNRVERPKINAGAGGLAVALGDVLRKRGGTWFGWSGNVVADGAPLQTHSESAGKIHYVTTDLHEHDIDQYYFGFSNQVLWPGFHYRLDLLCHRSGYWDGYQRVNRHFANLLNSAIAPGDTIWVHDYHLIPLAAMLRRMGFENRIGFFHHVPLPPSQVLLAIPQNQQLVRDLFAYDLVGFQTARDLEHFRRHITDYENGKSLGDDRLSCYGRVLSVGAFPASIDVAALRATLTTQHARQTMERQQKRNLDRFNVIGVDRLDYSKGLVHRMQAYRKLLEEYPENRGNVTLTQIAPPSRENVDAYAEIRTELERLSGEINGQFGDFDWTPVRYIHRTVPRRTLVALFATSRVGLVTPLRDGMNLVAKEYVAAQDADDPGVLILSLFAGAAETLREALIVNPYDVDSVAAALERALRMPVAERRERHAKLYEQIANYDNRRWVAEFLERLAGTALQAAA